MKPLQFAILVSTSLAWSQSLTVTPKSIERGKVQSFVVSDTQTPCRLKDAFPDYEATGFAITKKTVSGDGCKVAFTVTTTDATRYGLVQIPIFKNPTAPQIIDSVSVDVVGLLPSPIPPGIDPQVDVMWKVLPHKNVADSFGRKVAHQYFAIEVVIGNNTGYPLQIASIGFDCLEKSNPSNCSPLPNDAYNITRSTIERDRETGRRAVALNAFTAATGIFSVMGGLFTNGSAQAEAGRLNFLSARDRYSIFLGMLNPISTGANLIFPDKTIRQLVGLDTRAFRDSVLISNNTHHRILTFISRELVEFGKTGKVNSAAGRSNSEQNSPDCSTCPHNLNRLEFKKNDFSPKEVMRALGSIVIVGHQIEYKQRMRVVNDALVSLAMPPVVSNPTSIDVMQGEGGAAGRVIRLTGNGLDGISVTLEKALADVNVTLENTAANGSQIEIKVVTGDKAETGTTLLKITKPGTQGWTIPFTVSPAKP